MESILDSIKKMLGVPSEYTQFDIDIIMHINSVFSVLSQLGVGPENNFTISDNTSTWHDFIGDDTNIEMVKSYILLKVRLLFDPPISACAIESMNRQVSEFEWRLNIAAETKPQCENSEEEFQNG